MAIAIGFVIGRIAASLSMEDIFYFRKDYNLPKSVVLEKSSPNGLYIAQILLEDKSKAYFLALQGENGDRMILDREIAPASGYHNPIFKISWDKNSENIFITVDHDFGEGNLSYVFDRKKIRLGSGFKP